MRAWSDDFKWIWILFAIIVTLAVAAAVCTPNLLRSRTAAEKSRAAAMQRYNTEALRTVSLQAGDQMLDREMAEADDRKMIRTSSLILIAKSPTETAEIIRALAEGVGGFLVSSQTAGGPEAANASLVIRVPVARFEEVRAAIRKLGIRIENENLEAQDVTRQYVDQEARLRNLRAEETQYLAIMKRAVSVKDTLEVSAKLSEVRGQVEQQQAEFSALSKQVETVMISISLHTEADVSVFGLNWRPLYQFKMSAREGMLALGNYVASMTAFLFYLPAVLLWLATIFVGAAVGWRILKWAERFLFGAPKAAMEGAR